MAESIRIAFERNIVTLAPTQLLPLKLVSDVVRKSLKYKRIEQSIAEVGIIEPLVVSRSKDSPDRYLVLDGHLRLAMLTDQGCEEVRCIVADDDEAFTYNKRINRLTGVQEHFMIVRAIERGVSEERLAKALNMNIQLVQRRRTMLNGICSDVVELFNDKPVNHVIFEILRKMKPARQITAANLMISAGNYTVGYAKAILAGTKPRDLVKPDQPKKVGGLTSEQMTRMEHEMEALQRDFKAIEASYGDDMLHLVVASGYLSRLVGNRAIGRYLRQYHNELLEEFRAIIAAASLDKSVAAE